MAVLQCKVFYAQDFLGEVIDLRQAGYVSNFEACCCPLDDAWRAYGPAMLIHTCFKPPREGAAAIVSCFTCRGFHVQYVADA